MSFCGSFTRVPNKYIEKEIGNFLKEINLDEGDTGGSPGPGGGVRLLAPEVQSKQMAFRLDNSVFNQQRTIWHKEQRCPGFG